VGARGGWRDRQKWSPVSPPVTPANFKIGPSDRFQMVSI
jgi:hypothetical protein